MPNMSLQEPFSPFRMRSWASSSTAFEPCRQREGEREGEFRSTLTRAAAAAAAAAAAEGSGLFLLFLLFRLFRLLVFFVLLFLLRFLFLLVRFFVFFARPLVGAVPTTPIRDKMSKPAGKKIAAKPLQTRGGSETYRRRSLRHFPCSI